MYRSSYEKLCCAFIYNMQDVWRFLGSVAEMLGQSGTEIRVCNKTNENNPSSSPQLLAVRGGNHTMRFPIYEKQALSQALYTLF